MVILPKIKANSTVIITGGGKSLRKYVSRICQMLHSSQRVTLFDINGHFAELVGGQMARIRNPKFIFSRWMFATEDNGKHNYVYSRVKKFLTYKNAWLVYPENPATKDMVKPFGENIAFVKTVPVWEEWEKEQNATFDQNSFVMALGCVPKNAKQINTYGFDCTIIPGQTAGASRHDWESYHNGELVLAGYAHYTDIKVHQYV